MFTGQRERVCSLWRQLRLVPADMRAWEALAEFHYRGGRPATVDKVFAFVRDKPGRPVWELHRAGGHADYGSFTGRVWGTDKSHRRSGAVKTGEMDVVGVIVYSLPVLHVPLRDVATGGRYVGLGTAAETGRVLARELRTISRVVVHPAWRGIGLGTRLVRETLGRVGVPLVEALAVMGKVHPFFVKAGMRLYVGPRPGHAERLLAAAEAVGWDETVLADPAAMEARLEGLTAGVRRFLEKELRRFAAVYDRKGKRQGWKDVLTLTAAHVLARPAYFLWGCQGHDNTPRSLSQDDATYSRYISGET